MGKKAQRRRKDKEARHILKGFRTPALDMKMVRFSLPGPVWRDFCKAVRELNVARRVPDLELSPAGGPAETLPTQWLYHLIVSFLAKHQADKRKAEDDKRLVKEAPGSLLGQLQKFEQEHPGETPRIILPGEEARRGRADTQA